MIRTTVPLNLKRRIAVIRPAPVQVARLGSVAAGYPAGPQQAYTTLSVMAPETSQSWMSQIMDRQDRARLDTPGTLFYTPANRTPPANVAPWNSWRQPNCGNGAPTPAPAAAAIDTPAGQSQFWKVIGALAGAASALYIVDTITRKERR